MENEAQWIREFARQRLEIKIEAPTRSVLNISRLREDCFIGGEKKSIFNWKGISLENKIMKLQFKALLT